MPDFNDPTTLKNPFNPVEPSSAEQVEEMFQRVKDKSEDELFDMLTQSVLKQWLNERQNDVYLPDSPWTLTPHYVPETVVPSVKVNTTSDLLIEILRLTDLSPSGEVTIQRGPDE